MLESLIFVSGKGVAEARHSQCLHRAGETRTSSILQSQILMLDKSWLDVQFHKGTTEKVIQPHELHDQLEKPPQEEIDDSIRARIWGSIVGLALGDAVGAHVEFRPRDYLIEHPVTDMRAGGTWGLEIGQVTLFSSEDLREISAMFRSVH